MKINYNIIGINGESLIRTFMNDLEDAEYIGESIGCSQLYLFRDCVVELSHFGAEMQITGNPREKIDAVRSTILGGLEGRMVQIKEVEKNQEQAKKPE